MLDHTAHDFYANKPLISSLFFSRYLRGMPSGRPDEALEGCTLRVDAQRHSFALLVFGDETMDELFALPDRKHALLIAVAEGPLCSRFEVSGVHSAAGYRIAAFTHACVVPQAAFV